MQLNEWIIVADSPDFPRDIVTRITENHSVVALDGAADLLRELNILPDVIIGDFDSIANKEYWGIRQTLKEEKAHSKYSEPYLGSFGVLIVPIFEQNHTDLEKGIMYCDRQGADSILILNATGGRLDHTLGNIGTLRKYYLQNRPMLILTERELIEYVKDSQTIIRGKIGDQCAIMAYPEAVMTTTGLSYNGNGYPLKLGIQESTCNTLAEEQASIYIDGEAIVIHPLPLYE